MKRKWCVNSEDGKGAFWCAEWRLIKSVDSGLEWKWDWGCRVAVAISSFFSFFYDMRAIWQWNESKENEKKEGRVKREREIEKSCKVPFVMMSYSIYRDQFRDLSVVSEFTVPREIGTLRKNVMCTHIRRRSSRTFRRRVRSRLDFLLGRW